MGYGDHLPQAVLRDGKLYVGDDEDPFFRADDSSIFLNVSDLKIDGRLTPGVVNEKREKIFPNIWNPKIDGRFRFVLGSEKTE